MSDMQRITGGEVRGWADLHGVVWMFLQSRRQGSDLEWEGEVRSEGLAIMENKTVSQGRLKRNPQEMNGTEVDLAFVGQLLWRGRQASSQGQGQELLFQSQRRICIAPPADPHPLSQTRGFAAASEGGKKARDPGVGEAAWPPAGKNLWTCLIVFLLVPTEAVIGRTRLDLSPTPRDQRKPFW